MCKKDTCVSFEVIVRDFKRIAYNNRTTKNIVERVSKHNVFNFHSAGVV